MPQAPAGCLMLCGPCHLCRDSLVRPMGFRVLGQPTLCALSLHHASGGRPSGHSFLRSEWTRTPGWDVAVGPGHWPGCAGHLTAGADAGARARGAGPGGREAGRRHPGKARQPAVLTHRVLLPSPNPQLRLLSVFLLFMPHDNHSPSSPARDLPELGRSQRSHRDSSLHRGWGALHLPDSLAGLRLRRL